VYKIDKKNTSPLVRLLLLVHGQPAWAHVHEKNQSADNRCEFQTFSISSDQTNTFVNLTESLEEVIST